MQASEQIWRTRTKFACVNSMVLQHGYFFQVGVRPKEMRLGVLRQCYRNAALLALDCPDLIYTEGLAATEDMVPLEHAWVIDLDGKVIETTWRRPGVVYAGIPFRRASVQESLRENGYYG